MRMFRNSKIKVKVFVMIGVIMSFIILLSFGSFYYTYFIYDKQLYDKSSRLLNLSLTTVDAELQRLESLSFNIMSDDQIQQSLKELAGNPSDYTAYTTRSVLGKRIWSITSAMDRYVQSVHLIDPQGKSNEYGEGLPTPVQKFNQLIHEAKLGEGAIRWVNPEESDPTLILVREIRSYEPLTLKPLGFLIIRINIKKLVEDYAATVAENSDIIIMSEQSMVYPYQELSDQTGQALRILSSQNGYSIGEINGEASFVSQILSPYTGWSYYNVVAYNQIFQTIIWLKNLMIVLFAAAAIVMVIMGLAFARSLTKPIEALINQMKDIQKGDLGHVEQEFVQIHPYEQMDEVGLLHRTFRLMMTRINTLITENYAKQLVIKETEFKALQAQINPHFLYNTLDSINWLAQKNKQDDISSMVVSLGFLLRASISLQQNTITIGKEMEIIDHYIRIQTYRFRDRLDFQMDIPDQYHAVLIPKLTLQPLLENAIKYGLEPVIGICRIRIYAETEEDLLILIVEDSGPGLEENYLLRLVSGETVTKSTGIGLSNIQERMKMVFGEAYGIQLESQKGIGTKVKVLIPLQKGAQT
jgi:two-component system, sensor histidine kinase YesM